VSVTRDGARITTWAMRACAGCSVAMAIVKTDVWTPNRL
jgi:hypothetical protein